MITLGSKVTDKITGFTGIVTGRCEYLTGCSQFLVATKSMKNADPTSAWFDEQRLEVDKKAKPIFLNNGKTLGFDKPAPKR